LGCFTNIFSIAGGNMGWKCYSCGTENSNKEAMCTKCGNTVAAPSSFYVHWIFGAAMFFMVFYLAGTMAGGVLVEAISAPQDEDVLIKGNQLRKEGTSEFKSIMEMNFEEQAAARALAGQEAKSAMSPVLRGLIQWTLPVILFILCGIIVGFVSDGVTIIEAAIGSALGQTLAVVLTLYVFKADSISWMAFGIGVLPGIGLGALGAWLGEIIQDRKERAGGITA
jgi:hypothetical protein